MRRVLALLMLASLCFAWQKKGKSPKMPEIAVIQVICQRADGDVVVDGKFRIQSEKPVSKLNLLIDFLGTDKQLLQTKRGQVDDAVLKQGEETEFHMRVADPVRAVMYSLRAEDGDGRDLRLDKAGPFPIE